MAKTEQQRQITVDALELKLSGGTDTLPGRREFDQNTITAEASLFIKANELFGSRDRGVGIEGQASINLSGNTARNNAKNLRADIHRKAVITVSQLLCFCAAQIVGKDSGIFQ